MVLKDAQNAHATNLSSGALKCIVSKSLPVRSMQLLRHLPSFAPARLQVAVGWRPFDESSDRAKPSCSALFDGTAWLGPGAVVGVVVGAVVGAVENYVDVHNCVHLLHLQEAPVEASPSSDEGFAEAFAEGIPQG